MDRFFPLFMFLGALGILLLGYPVAFALSGSALLFAGLGYLFDLFDPSFLQALPERLYGMMTNDTLLAVPLFVFMGVLLERSKLSENLLQTMARAFGGAPGGLALSVCLVGGLLAASTGIVGATVVTMGLLSLPTMLRQGYSPAFASGIVCASGTLGQIIPPSIVLIILADVIGSASQQAQLSQGIFNPTPVSVGDLFLGALLPGILLMFFYLLYAIFIALRFPKSAPSLSPEERGSLFDPKFRSELLRALFPPLFLILAVLGSILFGVATPTEAASVGSVGAFILAIFNRQASFAILKDSATKSVHISAMVFAILIGASVFSLVFRGLSGDELVRELLLGIEGGPNASLFLVMALIFFLGFFLDFFEITFVVVPIVGPILLTMGFDPLWLGIMIALNLQTSFLTPPFGFSLFYLKGVAPAEITTRDLYRGVVPFICLQLMLMGLLWFFPQLATYLPGS